MSWLTRLGVWLAEGRREPLLETAFWVWTVEAEEEDVLVCYLWWEVLGVLKFGREGREVVADPAGSFAVAGGFVGGFCWHVTE